MGISFFKNFIEPPLLHFHLPYNANSVPGLATVFNYLIIIDLKCKLGKCYKKRELLIKKCDINVADILLNFISGCDIKT